MIDHWRFVANRATHDVVSTATGSAWEARCSSLSSTTGTGDTEEDAVYALVALVVRSTSLREIVPPGCVTMAEATAATREGVLRSVRIDPELRVAHVRATAEVVALQRVAKLKANIQRFQPWLEMEYVLRQLERDGVNLGALGREVLARMKRQVPVECREHFEREQLAGLLAHVAKRDGSEK